ncbi:dihydrofolate reductase [Spirosoma montaniterrae]|uniref:Dihydrofolate reductase n=1 Tax=Spirosoma montaniterrae TaxID=1178516 RepID=A0A1P9X4F2_9BACT|nr:dihydrofolate reductase [Spirosoma montaniterrae]AQG82491.1 diacylglycerol kinase [Spirosoma montaniterrae]
MNTKISLIAAVAQNGVIGCTNAGGKPDMPWHLPDDFAYFKRKTLHHPIIMGRKSLDALGKPLPKRDNIVLTRNKGFQAEGVTVVHTLDDAIKTAKAINQHEIFVIGGAEIYAMALPTATNLYLTEIQKTYDGDARFPNFDRAEWEEVHRQHHPADDRHETAFDFVEYARR